MAKRFPLLLICVLLALLSPGRAAVAAPSTQTDGNDTASNDAGVRIMLPAISGQPQETPPEVAEDGRVYGLLGTLLPATEQSFATYLELADGRRIGLVGSTPSIETEISTLRGPLGGVQAKVWGIYRPATATAGAVIIVTDILPVTPELPPPELPPTEAPTAVPATPAPATPVPPTPVPPTPTPEPIGQDKAVAIVMFDLVNVRTGPGNRFPPSGQVVKDQVCDIIGRNELETWYLIDCLSGARGWMDKRLVEVQGNTELVPILGETTDVAVVTPTPGILPPEPTPSPTPDVAPAPVDYWKATFFNNTQLLPPVALSATAGDINFNWGGGSPHPAVTSVNFSARFERAINYAPGFS
ncbi:MAG: SH3 domain-containing protein [Caldilineaceae bacterium]